MSAADIRLAETADRERVFALLRAQLSEHSIQPSDAGLEYAIDRLLLTPELGQILVASASGNLVGVAVVSFGVAIERGGRSAWLEELYVEPAHRGAGLGTELLRRARAIAAAAGATALDLEVEAGHERAANLYRREGFVRLQREHWTLDLSVRDSRRRASWRRAGRRSLPPRE